jgi:outer membrane lipoprotein-sorting protein
MKKILFLLLLLIATAVRADDRSAQILRRMTAAFEAYASYRIDFRASMEDVFDDVPGTLTVSGERYLLDVYDSVVSFDGTTVYNYSKENREVILEKPDPGNTALFANPPRMFRLYNSDFTHTFKGEVTRGGRTLAVVELTPRTAGGYEAITLEIDRASGLPASIAYRMPGAGAVSLEIASITPNVEVNRATFVFDRAKHPGVEVIDFR